MVEYIMFFSISQAFYIMFEQTNVLLLETYCIKQTLNLTFIPG